MSAEQATWFRQTFDRIKSEVNKVIVGQEEVVDSVLIGLAANGHILLEGMPGLGKTLLVKSLSQALSLDFSRIQFTPDMMHADVTVTKTDTGMTRTTVTGGDGSFAMPNLPVGQYQLKGVLQGCNTFVTDGVGPQGVANPEIPVQPSIPIRDTAVREWSSDPGAPRSVE